MVAVVIAVIAAESAVHVIYAQVTLVDAIAHATAAVRYTFYLQKPTRGKLFRGGKFLNI